MIVDPTVAVPNWGLSDVGRARVDQFGSGCCYFSVLQEGRRVQHPWRKMEEPFST